MMSTINKIFVDTSVLVEAFKGNKIILYNRLITNIQNDLCINDIVLSEYLYYVLGYSGATSPRSLQERNELASIVNSMTQDGLVPKDFSFIQANSSLFTLAPQLMAKYNLLPNDAIV